MGREEDAIADLSDAIDLGCRDGETYSERGLAWRALGNVAQAAGFALLFPAMQAIVSQRVERENQSKCFSAVSAVATIGIMLGMPFYSGVIFDGTASGMHRALPSLVSAFLAVICTLLAASLSATARLEPSLAKAPDG